MKNLKKSLRPRGLRRGSGGAPEAAWGALPGRPLAPALSGNFSILGAVLEPQSRGVLIRDKPESRGCQWGLPAVFMGSEEGDLTDDAAFFRHSRHIERSFSA